MTIALKVPPTQVAAEVVVVTPKVAAEMLLSNTSNRNVRPTVVGRYARDMAAGEWTLNGETIKVSETGVILDGQHRLHAVVKAGVAVTMFVVSGLPDSVQPTVDRGLPRNIADAFRLRGEINVTELAAAVSQAILLKSPSPTMNGENWPSTSEAIRYLDAHPNIRESIHVGDRVRKLNGFAASTAAALHHIFSEIDQEDADTFWSLYVEGANLPSDSPILRLRELMFRERTAPRRMNRSRLFAVTIKAWNAWRRGQPMQLLKWKVGGSNPESFPRPE